MSGSRAQSAGCYACGCPARVGQRVAFREHDVWDDDVEGEVITVRPRLGLLVVEVLEADGSAHAIEVPISEACLMPDPD